MPVGLPQWVWSRIAGIAESNVGLQHLGTEGADDVKDAVTRFWYRSRTKKADGWIETGKQAPPEGIPVFAKWAGKRDVVRTMMWVGGEWSAWIYDEWMPTSTPKLWKAK